MTLNKFIAHAGVTSRRKAADLIKSGTVTVNGIMVDDPGYRITSAHSVKIGNKVLRQESKIYIVLNKPNNYLTTVSDEKGRKTVLDLLQEAPQVRLYPVGRLDRNSTGLLLITNDGDLAQTLAHPSYEIRKTYTISLTSSLKPEHLTAIKQGILLEDGMVKVDGIIPVAGSHHTVFTINLHSGKNRIIRRIFESFGYEIKTLDRTMYAGLTKKGLVVGRWRFLTPAEVIGLKKMAVR